MKTDRNIKKPIGLRFARSATLLALAVPVIAYIAYLSFGILSGSASVSEQSAMTSSDLTIVKIDGQKLPVGAKVAPELSGISGWLNTESPLSLEDLRGKVVLVDFWTYSCVNCIRTIPYLKAWHEKYSDQGLFIIGVHSPEFEFEKIPENVQTAIGQYELPYAVALDNEFQTWDSYNALYWPTKFLVDADGYIRYSLVGEGHYEETEEMIRKLLSEAGVSSGELLRLASTDPSADERARTGDPETSLTVELFAGYEWSDPNGVHYIRNPEFYYQKDEARTYQDPGHRRNNYIFLHGLWHNGPEYITHARQTQNLDDYIAIQFKASSVNAVLAPKDNEVSFEVVVTLDGEYLTSEESGEDVVIKEDGVSVVTVDQPRMYQLVMLPEFQTRELALSSNSDQFSLYSFTFGAYQNGP